MLVRSDQVVVTCDDIIELLSGALDGTMSLTPEGRAHVESCLRCQAEAVQFRKLQRGLRALRADLVEPHPGMLTDLLVAVAEGTERRAVRSRINGRRMAYVSGIAATAAGVGGVIVLASRTRRRLPLAG
jgi:hypothetical protein